MKGKRFTEEQIIGVLKEAETGLPQPDLLRKHGISQGTFYRWKAKYGGLDVSEARRLKSLEDENRRLKRLVADQALDIQILKDINSKNGDAHGPAGRRQPHDPSLRDQPAARLWVGRTPPKQPVLQRLQTA